MEQGIRKERKKERDGKGFYLNMRTCRPEIALSCMTEHEPLPHTRFVYACVCLEFNGCNVQVSAVCTDTSHLCNFSLWVVFMCLFGCWGWCVYMLYGYVWVCSGHCASSEGWSGPSALSPWSVSADGEGTLSQCCWTVACLTTQTKRWEQPLSHSHTDKHTHRANTTYISFCLISLHTISNLQRADCYSMFKGSCRQLSPCFLLPYRPMSCVTVTRIPYVKYVACLVGWCVFTPMLNAKSVIPQP